MIIQYARRTFTGYQGLPRSPDIPPITEAQAEALDALHFLAERYAVGLDFRQGDIQFANNLSIFHARDGYTNSPEKKYVRGPCARAATDQVIRRHLVRLWLRDPEYAWATPSDFQARWDGLYKGVSPDKTVFPLEPYLRSASKGTAKT